MYIALIIIEEEYEIENSYGIALFNGTMDIPIFCINNLNYEDNTN